MKSVEAENYKKQQNLKLSDYLRLTSLSKKSSSNSKNKSLQSERIGKNRTLNHPTNRTMDETLESHPEKNEIQGNNSCNKPEKKKTMIDNEQGILMVKN